MTNIKITALTDIGNNIAPTTLIPVVDMAGPSTTKKATLQNAGNLILSGAGLSNFVPAARAILAQSVTNAAQPNITSTGTLTSLTVSGNVNLGSVSNIIITGGTSGQVLSTDGNGVLSWVNDANSSYGDSNVVSLIAAFGSNTISTTGLITGDGGGLSNVPYANVTGTPTLGNVSAINLDGNVSNVLRGDGTFAGITFPTTLTANLDANTFSIGNVGNVTMTGNISAARLQNDGNLVIQSNVAGTPKSWTFDSLGDVSLPLGGNISGTGYVTAQRIITDPVPLANITAVAGGRAFISDGNLVAAGNFGAQVGGGGANIVPVYSDGTNWYIG
jgi:hypothetical protein